MSGEKNAAGLLLGRRAAGAFRRSNFRTGALEKAKKTVDPKAAMAKGLVKSGSGESHSNAVLANSPSEPGESGRQIVRPVKHTFSPDKDRGVQKGDMPQGSPFNPKTHPEEDEHKVTSSMGETHSSYASQNQSTFPH